MSTTFDRLQAAYDSMEPPEPDCSHEEWEAKYALSITSSTQDISIFCDKCHVTGSLDFNDAETFSVNWDE